MRIPSVDNPISEDAWTFSIEEDAALGEIAARLKLALLTLEAGLQQPTRLKLHGHLEFTHTAECARCLKPVTVPVVSNFESLIDLKEGTIEAADLETPPEVGGFERVSTSEIDLEEELRQRVYLAIPDVVSCRPDCKGLCSRCGANLNIRDCDCNRRNVRGPLAGLAALLQKKSPETGGR